MEEFQVMLITSIECNKNVSGKTTSEELNKAGELSCWEFRYELQRKLISSKGSLIRTSHAQPGTHVIHIRRPEPESRLPVDAISKLPLPWTSPNPACLSFEAYTGSYFSGDACNAQSARRAGADLCTLPRPQNRGATQTQQQGQGKGKEERLRDLNSSQALMHQSMPGRAEAARTVPAAFLRATECMRAEAIYGDGWRIYGGPSHFHSAVCGCEASLPNGRRFTTDEFRIIREIGGY
ncbi:hypothetical protein AXG93_1231s1200 [Marchantia polymorpha subsp. ruderalis]|uniref:Uncharacterized protein n=1 Tax=Marchantia polymorpha subsp. ruderalis TaxID=1480154 RepID=A0A176VQT7_MARPO|nr:hypothetical protein AXG93_1231s1200 [Marchantia polymorpha subsp. ruderalis]